MEKFFDIYIYAYILISSNIIYFSKLMYNKDDVDFLYNKGHINQEGVLSK